LAKIEAPVLWPVNCIQVNCKTKSLIDPYEKAN
jgi:hypothetical protein